MIEFFRDVLNGPLYIVVTIVSVIFIMAIIGFIMERKKLEKEAKDKIAVVNNVVTPTPISPVTVEQQPEMVVPNIQQPTIPDVPVSAPLPQEPVAPVVPQVVPVSDLATEQVFSQEVKPNVIVFEDPDKKTE